MVLTLSRQKDVAMRMYELQLDLRKGILRLQEVINGDFVFCL